ncbi:right-handed parallel beta-helix repeat-containing protein [Phocaeicola vulgatus]|nr:right-handed parallel beta-helix repeat-containing protein [Phocaeicola vulgatus]
MWISGYFAHGYADDMICVESIDTIHKMIHTRQHTVYGFMTGAPWRQWFALNLLEELDVPGEYVIDAGRGKMYVYPPAGKMENWSVSLLESPLMAIEHCKDVKVQGITFEYGRHIGVYMENTHRALIKNCIIRNMGGVGVSIGKGTLKAGNQRGHESGGSPASRVVGDLMGTVYQNILFNREGGTENGVVDCYIYNVGAGGISLGGGDRASLTPAGNYVENCRIHDYNRIEKSYRPGIWMDGVGNRISKCDIYNAPSMAILFHGNNHVIELCDITNVCSEVDDQGAVYYGRDPSEQGNVIRYCYFHELSPRHRVTATYHDDGACGAEVYGNIYYKAGSLPVLIGGGHNNHYRHNIFIDSPVAIHIDARMQGWGKFMIEKGAIIDQRLQTVNYKNPPYSTVYPLLAEYWDNDTSYPKGNVIEGNLFYKIGNVVRGRTEWLELYNNWATGLDPGFVDAADPLKGFKDDALIYQRINGFPQLPFEKIGCDLSK